MSYLPNRGYSFGNVVSSQLNNTKFEVETLHKKDDNDRNKTYKYEMQ